MRFGDHILGRADLGQPHVNVLDGIDRGCLDVNKDLNSLPASTPTTTEDFISETLPESEIWDLLGSELWEHVDVTEYPVSGQLNEVEALSGVNEDLALIYDVVRSHGTYNFCGARIPLKHGLNINSWRNYLDCYDDKEVIEFLEFGFPINYAAPSLPLPSLCNHASARCFPKDVAHYLDREIGYEAMAGPFDRKPFVQWFQTNELRSRGKEKLRSSSHYC